MKLKTLYALTLTAAALLISPYSATAAECLVIGTDQKSKISQKFQPGITKTFERAGLCVEYKNMPGKRAQQAMSKGEIDVETMRVIQYVNGMSDHVVHVPTPVVSAGGYLITLKSSGFTPAGLAEIGDKKLGIIRGYAWHAGLSKNIKNTKITKDYGLLIKQIKAKRIDAFMIDSFTLGSLIKTGAISKAEIFKSEKIIDLSAFLVLHKSHSALVSKLDTALKEVQSEGAFKTN